MYKIIVAGGRDFNNYPLLKKVLAEIFNDPDIIAALKVIGGVEIVSGKQVTKPKLSNGYPNPDPETWYGADWLGEKYAKANGIPVKEFPADWDQFGKPAGMIRNKAMGYYADALIAFWDKRSHGTKNMIDIMYELIKPYDIINY